MFRPMQRIKKQLSEAQCIEILKKELRGVLSVLGDDDYPYAMPMDHWYCEADGKIYFHCGLAGHRTDALKKHDKVSFCVSDAGYREEGDWALYIRSVIVFGRARIVRDMDRVIEITRQLSLKFTDDLDFIEEQIRLHGEGPALIELTIEHMTGKLVHEQ